MKEYKNFDNLFNYDPEMIKIKSRSAYLDAAERYWKEYGPSFEAYALEVIKSDTPMEDELSEFSHYIAGLAQEHLPKKGFKSTKRKQIMDDSLFMVTFVLSSLISYNDEKKGVSISALPDNTDFKKINGCFKQLASALALTWGEVFKVEPLGIAATLKIADAYGDTIIDRELTRARNFFSKD